MTHDFHRHFLLLNLVPILNSLCSPYAYDFMKEASGESSGNGWMSRTFRVSVTKGRRPLSGSAWSGCPADAP